MEALSSSVFASKFSETLPPVLRAPLSSIRTQNRRNGSLKMSETFPPRGSRAIALAREISDEGEEDTGLENNRLSLVSEESLFLSQGKSDYHQESEKVAYERPTPFIISYGNGTGGSTRAGLFRTPISGGVQSATTAHGLPRPALAVRNLMEQARFAHLCTVMSQMHHRREGYPFGSLVDFAPDSMGHPIFSFSPLAIHTRNLLADPRCTLVVQIPGWSGLSNARVTIFGDVFPLPEHQQEWVHKQYIAKHQQGPSQQWGNFYYFRMQNIRWCF